MISSNSQSWTVEHRCPQCGAPVTLQETDRIFSCSFCRVRLFMWSGDHFRYFLAPGASSPEPPVFVPYWRLKGIVYSPDATQISSRIIDSSLIAVSSLPLPACLGVRPQVLKLRYVTPDVPGNFLKPALPFRALVSGGMVSPTDQVFHDFFIGEVVSQIFSPVFVRGNLLFDAVLQRPLGAVPEALRDSISKPGDNVQSHDSADQLSFIATLCPRCGWDLDAERDSMVLFCRNCNSAWQAECGALRPVSYSFLQHRGEPAIYLPFWRIRAGISAFSLKSHSDLLRLANLQTTVVKPREDSELHYWIPAFKSQPNLFLRLARTLTILQKDPADNFDPAKSPLFPVTLPVSEALESIRILIASIAVPKRLILPRIHEMEVSHKDHSLAYLPFTESGEELIQPEIQMSIQKNALKWGRLI